MPPTNILDLPDDCLKDIFHVFKMIRRSIRRPCSRETGFTLASCNYRLYIIFRHVCFSVGSLKYENICLGSHWEISHCISRHRKYCNALLYFRRFITHMEVFSDYCSALKLPRLVVKTPCLPGKALCELLRAASIHCTKISNLLVYDVTESGAPYDECFRSMKKLKVLSICRASQNILKHITIPLSSSLLVLNICRLAEFLRDDLIQALRATQFLLYIDISFGVVGFDQASPVTKTYSLSHNVQSTKDATNFIISDIVSKYAIHVLKYDAMKVTISVIRQWSNAWRCDSLSCSNFHIPKLPCSTSVPIWELPFIYRRRPMSTLWSSWSSFSSSNTSEHDTIIPVVENIIVFPILPAFEDIRHVHMPFPQEIRTAWNFPEGIVLLPTIFRNKSYPCMTEILSGSQFLSYNFNECSRLKPRPCMNRIRSISLGFRAFHHFRAGYSSDVFNKVLSDLLSCKKSSLEILQVSYPTEMVCEAVESNDRYSQIVILKITERFPLIQVLDVSISTLVGARKNHLLEKLFKNLPSLRLLHISRAEHCNTMIESLFVTLPQMFYNIGRYCPRFSQMIQHNLICEEDEYSNFMRYENQFQLENLVAIFSLRAFNVKHPRVFTFTIEKFLLEWKRRAEDQECSGYSTT